MTDQPRRRSSDVPPAIELAIEDVAGRNRHAMRNEITAAVAPLAGRVASLEARVAESTLRSTEEHADVRAKLDRLGESVGVVNELAVRVTELEETDRADQAVAAALEKVAAQGARNADRLRNLAIGLATLIVTLALGVAALLLQH